MLAEGPVRAERGRVELTVVGELMEAWARLADTDEVGGPEDKIDRPGVLNRERCCVGGFGAARSSSGTGVGSARGTERREKMGAAAEASVGRGEGESLVIVGGKDHVGG